MVSASQVPSTYTNAGQQPRTTIITMPPPDQLKILHLKIDYSALPQNLQYVPNYKSHVLHDAVVYTKTLLDGRRFDSKFCGMTYLQWMGAVRGIDMHWEAIWYSIPQMTGNKSYDREYLAKTGVCFIDYLIAEKTRKNRGMKRKFTRDTGNARARETNMRPWEVLENDAKVMMPVIIRPGSPEEGEIVEGGAIYRGARDPFKVRFDDRNIGYFSSETTLAEEDIDRQISIAPKAAEQHTEESLPPILPMPSTPAQTPPASPSHQLLAELQRAACENQEAAEEKRKLTSEALTKISQFVMDCESGKIEGTTADWRAFENGFGAEHLPYKSDI